MSAPTQPGCSDPLSLREAAEGNESYKHDDESHQKLHPITTAIPTATRMPPRPMPRLRLPTSLLLSEPPFRGG